MDTYKATNTKNGKFYIGSTTNFKKRKKAHLRSKDNYPFQNALRKNPETFEWEVWSDDSDEPILEQALLDMWYGCEQCYNLNPQASVPPKVKGKRMWVHTSGKQTFSFECPGTEWGLGVNEARRQQNSRAKKGKKESIETRRKKSIAHIGKKRQFSEKHRANMSKSKKNNQPGARAGGLAAGKLNAELGKGFCSTEYRDSEKCGEDRIKASRKGADVSSRPVLITFESGSTNVFSSLSQAGRSTGMTSQSLGALAKSGKVGINGKYKGVRVEYVKG